MALVGLIVALLVLAVAGAIYQTIATKRAERAYPPPGEMVDVGGYSLHINCVGKGSPTVVLDGGSGEMSASWVLVQREVSDTTRVCAYDRAGMGWSEIVRRVVHLLTPGIPWPDQARRSAVSVVPLREQR
jgi:pimeloyl-ACP methyl ester carboxylesterase